MTNALAMVWPKRAPGTRYANKIPPNRANNVLEWTEIIEDFTIQGDRRRKKTVLPNVFAIWDLRWIGQQHPAKNTVLANETKFICSAQPKDGIVSLHWRGINTQSPEHGIAVRICQKGSWLLNTTVYPFFAWKKENTFRRTSVHLQITVGNTNFFGLVNGKDSLAICIQQFMWPFVVVHTTKLPNLSSRTLVTCERPLPARQL